MDYVIINLHRQTGDTEKENQSKMDNNLTERIEYITEILAELRGHL